MRKFLGVVVLLVSFIAQAQESFNVLISEQEIAQKIHEVAQVLNQEYPQGLTIVMIMKGALSVTADLMRELKIPVRLEYVKASSYGQNGTKAGQLTIHGFDALDLEGRDVLVIDDIFETGNTMVSIMHALREKAPKSLKSLVLLLKDVPHTTPYLPEYILFTIQDYFVVGYGLDYKELYRELPAIYELVLAE